VNKIREFMNQNEIPEALRLFVVNSLARTTAYDPLFAPMMDGDPAILKVALLKRKQIRVTAMPDLSKKLESEQADNRKLTAENMDLTKEIKEYDKRISKLTAELAKQKEAVKVLESENKKKPTKTESAQPEDIDS